MSSPDSIDVDFDRQFTDRLLAGQKYVWVAIAVLLAVTFIGLLGRGPLAKTTKSAGSLSLVYERVPHFKTPSVIEVRLPADSAQNGDVRLRIEGAIAGKAGLQLIVPQPVSSTPLPDGLIITLPRSEASRSGKVTLTELPSAIGKLESSIGMEGSPPVTFSQFVLP